MITFINATKWELKLGWAHFRLFMFPVIFAVAMLSLSHLLLVGEADSLYRIGPVWFSMQNIIMVMTVVLHWVGFVLSVIYPTVCFDWKSAKNIPERLSGHSWACLAAAKSVRAFIGALMGHGIIHFVYVSQIRFDIEFFLWPPFPLGWFTVFMLYAVIIFICPLNTMLSLWNSRNRRTIINGLLATCGVVSIGVIFATATFIIDRFTQSINWVVFFASLAVALMVSVLTIRRSILLYDNKAEIVDESADLELD